jgi:ABC-type branched-subunit amino acid transport system substrate-binding protein
MKNKLPLIILVVALVVGGAVFFSQRKTSEVVTQQKQTIKIGIMLPLTSQYGAIGEGVGKAADMAIKDFKASHPNIEIVTEQSDDKFDAKTGFTAYTKMTSLDHIDGLFMVSTPVLDALHEKMISDGIPVVCVGLQNDGVGKDNIFQMSADANGQIIKLAEYVQNNASHKKIALIHSTNAPASIGFYNAFSGVYTKDRVDLLINSKDDAKTIAAKIKESGADGVVFLTEPYIGSELTKNLLFLGVNPAKVAFYYDAQLQTGWSEYEKQVGDMKKLNGAITLQFTTSDLTEFKTKYKAMYGIDPSPFAEYGYDGITTLLNNYDTNKTTWVEKISKSDFKGYSGTVIFDGRGIRNQGTEVWVVKEGKVVKL